MDKKIAGLLGAAAALTTVGIAHAATTPTTDAFQATTYRDLLEPIPNAVALLRSDDVRLGQSGRPADVQLAQYHHHHHHHHHHGDGAGIIGGIIGGVIGGALAPHPACYWTWGRAYWNGYRWVRPRVQVCQ